MTGERGGGGGGQSRGYRKDRERRRNQECVDPTFRCIWKAIGMILHEVDHAYIQVLNEGRFNLEFPINAMILK